jgi:uncharacterized protein YidB (DUF937 family)
MGLIQDLAAQLLSGQSTTQQHSLLASVASLINSPQVGGIAGLAKLFESQGLGQIVAGWISNGPNPPITAQQLQQVLGSQRIGEIAQKLGVDPNQAAAQLAAFLPHAVDHLTPNGAIPAEGSLTTEAILGALKSKFLAG